MTVFEQRTNIKAAAWTIGVHILLFLLFIWIRYATPVVPPVEELGMEVNLGTSEDGSGTDQPMATDAPAEAAATTTYKAAAQEPGEAKEIMQSDDPDAPAVAPVTATTNTTRNDRRTTPNVRNRNTGNEAAARNSPPQRPRYVYSGSNGPGGNSAGTNQAGTNEGNTTGNGDRGVPGGTPGAANYTGSPGNGTGGISHTVSGRSISPRQFVAEFNEGGRVIIKVTVDRDGNIVSKSVKSSPSAALSRIALQKVSQAKFSSNRDAAPQQFGEITIVFKTRS